ncbi:hypothetical protein QVD17_33306 [Tagetes erecta]|uniref:Glycosyl transferase CAP10 domain-containing protein n=1 Tax=Tagetes erecta TaxID=13708 RepID=A0AAD8JYM3_TARER|nr:hypothetical protein QVD17_33306 [Tagetes erecta]
MLNDVDTNDDQQIITKNKQQSGKNNCKKIAQKDKEDEDARGSNKYKSLHRLKLSLLVLVVVFVSVFMFLMVACHLNLYTFSTQHTPKSQTKVVHDFPLECVAWNQTQSCPNNYPTTHTNPNPSLTNNTCPDYFRWIHEDLRHWRATGITRDMVEIAKQSAHFRLIILDGKLYVEKFRKSIQTRDLFTLWGFQQLLRLYPGRIPDLELMFDCDDRPVFNINRYFRKKPNPGPPPLFKYCSDPRSLDIVSPDWSFWGWAETNQKPWEMTLKDIKEGNKRVTWKDRVPFAYWRGNPYVSNIRADLIKCNATNSNVNWGAHLFIQDWIKESMHGYTSSNVEDQCTYRYKIYIEGWSWSVSEKYIMACDSPTFYIKPRYYTFFARGMTPLEHFWPIRNTDMCKSLKFAVEWGNNHTSKAQEIGEASSRFIQEDMKMGYIYDYMLHLLTEYAKLLKFKPTISPNAVEVCSESMVCLADGNSRKFMENSLVRNPKSGIPCTMPPPYDPSTVKAIIDNKTRAIKQVEMWEDEYWKNQNLKHH